MESFLPNLVQSYLHKSENVSESAVEITYWQTLFKINCCLLYHSSQLYVKINQIFNQALLFWSSHGKLTSHFFFLLNPPQGYCRCAQGKCFLINLFYSSFKFVLLYLFYQQGCSELTHLINRGTSNMQPIRLISAIRKSFSFTFLLRPASPPWCSNTSLS